MTANTINADEEFKGYTITQDHITGFWSISDPVQQGVASNELFGFFTSRDLLKRWIVKVG